MANTIESLSALNIGNAKVSSASTQLHSTVDVPFDANNSMEAPIYGKLNPTLLGMPVEIKRMILGHLLTIPAELCKDVNGHVHFPKKRVSSHLHPGILRVNRDLHRHGLLVLHENRFISLCANAERSETVQLPLRLQELDIPSWRLDKHSAKPPIIMELFSMNKQGKTPVWPARLVRLSDLLRVMPAFDPIHQRRPQVLVVNIKKLLVHGFCDFETAADRLFLDPIYPHVPRNFEVTVQDPDVEKANSVKRQIEDGMTLSGEPPMIDRWNLVSLVALWEHRISLLRKYLITGVWSGTETWKITVSRTMREIDTLRKRAVVYTIDNQITPLAKRYQHKVFEVRHNLELNATLCFLYEAHNNISGPGYFEWVCEEAYMYASHLKADSFPLWDGISWYDPPHDTAALSTQAALNYAANYLCHEVWALEENDSAARRLITEVIVHEATTIPLLEIQQKVREYRHQFLVETFGEQDDNSFESCFESIGELEGKFLRWLWHHLLEPKMREMWPDADFQQVNIPELRKREWKKKKGHMVWV